MSIAGNHRTKDFRYSMTAEQCDECGRVIFPKRDVCPECIQPAHREIELSGKGTIYSFTTIYEAPPKGFADQVPYSVGLIELQEGPLITGRFTDMDPDELEIGLKVESVTRKWGEDLRTGPRGEAQIIYGFAFRKPVASVTRERG